MSDEGHSSAGTGHDHMTHEQILETRRQDVDALHERVGVLRDQLEMTTQRLADEKSRRVAAERKVEAVCVVLRQYDRNGAEWIYLPEIRAALHGATP